MSDEVGAIVIDVGTLNTKVGFAGDDQPKCVIPTNIGLKYTTSDTSTVGEANAMVDDDSKDTNFGNNNKIKQYYVGTQQLNYRRDNMEIVNPLENGLVKKWEEMEQLWSHSFHSLRSPSKLLPLLLSEPSFNTRPLRERMTEILFEKYEVPALFVCKSAVLAAFAAGKSTGLVLDSGAGITSAVPVYDGYVLSQGIVKQPVAGERLTEEWASLLASRQVTVNPRFMVSKKEVQTDKFKVTINAFPNTHASYHKYMSNQIVRDLKHSCAEVAEAAFNEAENAKIPTVQYELPDGYAVEVGANRFKVPEMMFNPSLLTPKAEDTEFSPVHKMVYDSITSCDSDIRRELFTNILVTGGNTGIKGFVDRLDRELRSISAPQKLKIIATSNNAVERRYGAWIGGSILGSLGSFHKMWMSKSEYEERGKALVGRKCP